MRPFAWPHRSNDLNYLDRKNYVRTTREQNTWTKYANTPNKQTNKQTSKQTNKQTTKSTNKGHFWRHHVSYKKQEIPGRSLKPLSMPYPTNRFFVGYGADPYPTKNRILQLTTGLWYSTKAAPQKDRVAKIECRTSNVERRTSNVERQTSNVEHRTLDVERRSSNVERRTSNIEHQTSNIDHRTL